MNPVGMTSASAPNPSPFWNAPQSAPMNQGSQASPFNPFGAAQPLNGGYAAQPQGFGIQAQPFQQQHVSQPQQAAPFTVENVFKTDSESQKKSATTWAPQKPSNLSSGFNAGDVFGDFGAFDSKSQPIQPTANPGLSSVPRAVQNQDIFSSNTAHNPFGFSSTAAGSTANSGKPQPFGNSGFGAAPPASNAAPINNPFGMSAFPSSTSQPFAASANNMFSQPAAFNQASAFNQPAAFSQPPFGGSAAPQFGQPANSFPNYSQAFSSAPSANDPFNMRSGGQANSAKPATRNLFGDLDGLNQFGSKSSTVPFSSNFVVASNGNNASAQQQNPFGAPNYAQGATPNPFATGQQQQQNQFQYQAPFFTQK
jgi:hypothetical protein